MNIRSEHSNHTVQQQEYVGVELGSTGLKASALIPAWLLCGSPMPWLCDERTLSGSGAQPILDVQGCVALWCGFDPDGFIEPSGFSEAIAGWRAHPERWAAVGVPTFLQALDLAIAALANRALPTFQVIQDPPEATLVTVESFERWAADSKLVRPRDPRQEGFLRGRDLPPNLALLALVWHKHYRSKEDGGSLDIEDPSTHPLPEEVRATLRDAGCRGRTLLDRICAVARDPRLPVGRPNRSNRPRL